MAEPDKDYIRNQILTKLRRVPDWVNSADVQRVQTFKKFFAKTTKAVNNTRATVQTLQSTLNSVESMYQ